MLLAAVWLLALVVLGSPFRSAPWTRWLPLMALTVSGIAGWAVTLRWPSERLIRLLAAIALLVVASGISALGSAYPSVAWAATWNLAMLGGTGMLIWRAAETGAGRRNLIALATIFLVVILAAFIGQALVLWGRWLSLGMPVTGLPLRPGLIGGIAHLATWVGDYIVLLTPVVVVSLWGTARSGRLAAAVIGLASVVAILLTGTRSLWLIVGLVGVGLLAMSVRSRGVSRRHLALGLLVLVGGFLLAWQLGIVGRVTRDLDEGRSSAFASAIEQATARPIIGGGPGTYGVYRLAEHIPVFDNYAFPTAHDIVLNTVAETGLVGLAAFIVAGVLCVLQVRWAWRFAGDGRAAVLAAVTGLLVVLAHSMVDVVFEVPGIMVMALLVAAFAFTTPHDAVAPDEGPAQNGGVDRRRSRMTVAVVLVIIVASVLAMVRGEVSAAEQLAARSDSRGPGAALEAARSAADLTPDSVPALTSLVVAADAVGDLATATDAAARRAELEGLQQHRIELGVLQVRSGRRDEAARTLRDAVTRDQVDPLVQLNAALLDGSGLTSEERAQALRRLVASKPLMGLVASELPPAARSLFTAAVAGAVDDLLGEGRVDAALQAALAAGDAGAAQAVLAASDSSVAAFYGDVVQAWGGSRDAYSRVLESATRSPSRGNAAWWAWLLSARGCDASEARRWGEVWRIATGGVVAEPVHIGTAPDPGDPMLPPWYPMSIWGLDEPAQPYVAGTWVISEGTPPCAR